MNAVVPCHDSPCYVMNSFYKSETHTGLPHQVEMCPDDMGNWFDLPPKFCRSQRSTASRVPSSWAWLEWVPGAWWLFFFWSLTKILALGMDTEDELNLNSLYFFWGRCLIQPLTSQVCPDAEHSSSWCSSHVDVASGTKYAYSSSLLLLALQLDRRPCNIVFHHPPRVCLLQNQMVCWWWQLQQTTDGLARTGRLCYPIGSFDWRDLCFAIFDSWSAEDAAARIASKMWLLSPNHNPLPRPLGLFGGCDGCGWWWKLRSIWGWHGVGRLLGRACGALVPGLDCVHALFAMPNPCNLPESFEIRSRGKLGGCLQVFASQPQGHAGASCRCAPDFDHDLGV